MAPKWNLGNRQWRYGAVAAGIPVAGAVGYVGVIDPHRPGSPFPLCPFRLLTGWDCPACGGLRMLHDLLHADLPAAAMDNVFLLAGIPLLAAWILVGRNRGQPMPLMPALAVIAAVTTAWTLLRNLPGFPLVPIVFTG